jgi:probable addiction module antidote protein
VAKSKRKTRIKTRPYDSAEYLDTPEAIAEYLTDALEDDDPGFIAKAIGTAARARGMSEIAREAGVSRENLYRALSGDTKPEFDTIRRVLDALGVRLEVKPKAA